MSDTPKNEQALLAIETCFALIANAGFPVSKHDDVKAALSFLDSLHTQLKAEDAPEASHE